MTEAAQEDSAGPAWLRRLAAAAAAMEVPPAVRPPAVGGRRSAGLRRHAGQPAFPGGKIEDSDDGPVAAALREAAEETGLDPDGVEVLAVMPELYVMASQFRVVPVLAWWREPSAVGPVDIAEVALVERVSLADLANPANRVMIGYPDGHRGPAFRISSMMIWGFTGLITDRLLHLGGWEQPWDDQSVERDIPRARLLRPPA